MLGPWRESVKDRKGKHQLPTIGPSARRPGKTHADPRNPLVSGVDPAYDPASVALNAVSGRTTQRGVRMADGSSQDGRALLVVARGQASLLEALREFVAELGWVDVIEDRREGASLLPRADRAETPSLAT